MGNAEVPGRERRRAKRIVRHCSLQTRQINPPGPFNDWEISTVRNISEAGVMFYSLRRYEVGSELEIMVKDTSLLEKEVKLCGTVVRCKPAPNLIDVVGPILIDINEVAVNFTKIDEETKNTLCKAIEFFTQNNNRDK